MSMMVRVCVTDRKLCRARQ